MITEQLSFFFMSEERYLPLTSNDNGTIKQWAAECNPLYARLHTQPCSDAAKVMVSTLAAKIHAVTGIARKPTSKFAFAVGAMTADLLKAQAQSPSRHCQRHLSSETFVGCKVGYRPFVKLLERMDRAGFIKVEKGRWFRRSADGAGKLTAIKATPDLLRFALMHGITPANSTDHFQLLPRPRAIPKPIKLARARVLIKGVKQPKSMMAIDPSDKKARKLAEQVNSLNAYYAEQGITPDRHHAFQRLFHDGDVEGFNWNKGGRLYSVGESYQHMSQEERAAMLINGQPVVEIDINASHTRILHGLLGQRLDPSRDPYEMDGLPREVVKDFVTMTLGHTGFQRAWSPRKKEEYAERGIDLQKAYPIAEVRQAVLDQLPLLKRWKTSPVRWADLQYVESNIIMDCMDVLAFDYDVPALPVHDSIIVPVEHQALAMEVLSICFHVHTGAMPMLKVKGRM